MTNKIAILGLNHKTSPVEIRERLAFPPSKLSEAFRLLKETCSVKESVIISTCNRVEIYIAADNGSRDEKDILFKFLKEFHGVELTSFEEGVYFYSEPESVRHLFSVASGLDSMVIGETEVFGQVKSAYEAARQAGMTREVLNPLFQKAFNVAKEIRTKTLIGKGGVSVSSVACELAKKIFEDLSEKTIMILGAGKMGESTAKYLISRGIKSILVSNRSYERALELALVFGGKAIKFDDCFDEMANVDIVISSTGAPHFLIKPEEIKEVMHRRRSRPIFIIDISVPRNVDPKVGILEDVYLYNIDDLKQLAEENINKRRAELEKGLELIDERVKEFLKYEEDNNRLSR